MQIDDLIMMVGAANPDRSPNNINRRLIKIMEEVGEASEAFLSVSSPHNYKAKTWLDYREESVDTLIVLIDVGLTVIENMPMLACIPLSVEAVDDSLMDLMFEVSGCVSAAAHYFKTSGTISVNAAIFYEQINRAIAAATNMCFAQTPDDEPDAIIYDAVHSLFVKKLAKWNANMAVYAATDNG